MRRILIIALMASLLGNSARSETNLWQLATNAASVHRFSTLFTAQDVLHCLSSDAAIDTAIEWCKSTGITHVYLEEYRDGYLADRQTLEHARDRFRAAGFIVSGCVTTTILGKPSSGWGPEVCCYTDQATQAQLQDVFEFAASLFDEIMIDDYFFCDCKCDVCDAARQARRVTVGTNSYPVDGDTWSDYHRALMVHVSQDRVLAAAKRVNPKVRLIIKYPQWYDMYQERGYDVARQTASFDAIWAGAETRDYTNEVHWGGTVPYAAYFITRWLGGVGGDKFGGAWFDSFGTSSPYYLEQARQVVLAGARESFLFCYGSLNLAPQTTFPPSMPWPTPTGPTDIATLRSNMPELLDVAREVRQRHPRGIAIYKPVNSPGGPDSRIYDFLGMIGLPLIPCHEFPSNAPAAIFSLQSCADPNVATEINDYIKTGRPVMLTDALAKYMSSSLNLQATNVQAATLPRPLDYLLAQQQPVLDNFRAPLLKAIDVTFSAPDRVALYLFSPNGWVIENFSDEPVTVVLDGQSLNIAARGWAHHWN